MQVAKWGNSLAVRLPVAVIKALGLRDGDNIEIRIEDTREFVVRKKPGTRARLAALRKLRGRLPDGFSFDRDETHARR